MKNLFKLIGSYTSVICIGLFCPQYVSAQISQGDLGNNKWFLSLVHVQSVYTRKEPTFVKDTLIGTGFLLTDHNKLYLVTAKHLLQADLYGNNQQMANDSVYLRPPIPIYGMNMNISGLSGKEGLLSANVLFRQPDNDQKSAVEFSSDEENIAVISLQKTRYKNIAAYLLTRVKPIPIELIDIGNNHQADERLAEFGVSDYLSPKKINGNFLRVRGTGFTTSRINQYDSSALFFTIGSVNSVIMPGNNGSPIIANNRLIGMLSNATGIVSNHDIIQTPYYMIRTGRAIKAAYIVNCLRKLQQMEEDPAFDN